MNNIVFSAWFFFLSGCLLPACGNHAASSDTENAAGWMDTELPDIPEADDCAALSPLVPDADAVVVGDGTPSSCDAAALTAAIETVSTAGEGFIVFNCGDAPHTVALDSALQVRSSKTGTVVIDGGGVITISGASQTRIFDLDNHTNFVVQQITLGDGFVAANESEVTNRPSNSGAAIRHPWYGTLRVIDVDFVNNHCADRSGEIGGGAIYAGGLTEAVISGSRFMGNRASNGGGILNRGSNLQVLNCVFQENGALSQGSGQYGNGGGLYIDGMNYDDPGDFFMCGTQFIGNTAMTHGSGLFSYYYPDSSATIDSCLFEDNQFDAGGSGSGALYHEAAPLMLSRSAFVNNHGGEHAGGIFLGANSVAAIVNCSFFGNTVTGNGAGIFNGASVAEVTNCTFSENKADYGPAIFKGQQASVSLRNTLMVNNLTDNAYSATSCHEPLTDLGGNIQWPTAKNNGNPDPPCVEGILFADPLLEPLADNGGSTPTAAISASSPAIGYGAACPATDQRALPRKENCDAGAFENQ